MLLVVASAATPALAQYRIGMSAAITGPASSTYAPTLINIGGMQMTDGAT